MATTESPLSTESTTFVDAVRQQVQPKSYAAVVEEELPAYERNGTSEAYGANGTMSTNGMNGTAPVQEVVDGDAPTKKEEVVEDRAQNEKIGSNKGHIEDGPDEKQKLRTTPREHREAKTKSSTITSTAFAMYKGHTNGIDLTSIQQPDGYEEALRLDRREAKKLVSGRKAGQGWERSGIRFAPLNLPLRRRLQTMMVLYHTLCIAFAVSLFFFLCAIPIFWPLMIPYMMYCMLSEASTSGTLSARSEFLRSLRVWSLFASYFPARLHRSQELPPTRKYIFGYHPHGIISHGAFAAFATEALGFKQLFPGITNTLLTLDSNFRIPFYRDYALAMGLASVSKESCENILSKGGPNNEGMGRAITIVVGGARESLDAQPYYIRLILKRRKGFVKMAIRTGADLVPVLAFGENDLYDQFQADSHPTIHKIQLLVKKILGFTIPLFHARGVFNYDVGLMPYRRPLNVVVGKPIEVVQSSKPDQEYIDRVHEQYVSELERMWELWKDEFASERKEELQILE